MDKVYEAFATGYDIDDNVVQESLGLFKSRDDALQECQQGLDAQQCEMQSTGEKCLVQPGKLTTNKGTSSERVYEFFVVERMVRSDSKSDQTSSPAANEGESQASVPREQELS